MKDFDTKLGEKLKTIREQKGLSQSYVGDRLGVSRNCVSNYERGTRSINAIDLFRLADIYEIDVNDLIKELRKYAYKK